MDILCVDNLLCLNIDSNQSSLIGAVVKSLIKRAPLHIFQLMVSRGLEFLDEGWRSALLLHTPSEAFFEIVNSAPPIFILILENNSKVFVTVRALNFQSVVSWHSDLSQLVAIATVVNFDTDGGGCGEQVFGIFRHINALARVVDLEKSNSVVEVSVVHANCLIIGASEHKISIMVVQNFLNWTLMTSQVNWLH